MHLKPLSDEIEYLKFIYDTKQYNFIEHKINRLEIKMALSTNDSEFVESLYLIYLFGLALLSCYIKLDNSDNNLFYKKFLFDFYKKSKYYIDLLNLYITSEQKIYRFKSIHIIYIINTITNYTKKFNELF